MPSSKRRVDSCCVCGFPLNAKNRCYWRRDRPDLDVIPKIAEWAFTCTDHPPDGQGWVNFTDRFRVVVVKSG